MEVLDADQAVRRIPSGSTLTISGDGSILLPEAVLAAIERSFVGSGRPDDLALFYPVTVGSESGSGVDHLAHPGLVRSIATSCYDIWGIDRLSRLVQEEKIAGHCLPMGIMFHLLKAAAAGQPGILTRIGLDTFVDPAVRGSGQNRITHGSICERQTLDGEPLLLYRAPAVDVAIVCASVADEDGNLSLYREPFPQGVLAMALAARARRGLVIAQVKGLVRSGGLATRQVDVPGMLVDIVVVDPDQRQSVASAYDPSLSGEWSVPLRPEPLPLDPDKLMARRAALELAPGMVVNLGFGIGSLVAHVAAEEGVADRLTFSVEHGPVGGMPAGNRIFGAAVSPRALLRSEDVFALYHSGQLDLAILSAAEVDHAGNANVSRFKGSVPGPGGYIDITGGSRRLVLLGALTAGGRRLAVEGRSLRVVTEGTTPRFVAEVLERTFSAQAARARGATVRYVADRCTFDLGPDGLVLTEVAPGIDVQRDILEAMAFRPRVAADLRTWPERLFAPERMGLAGMWEGRP